MINRSSPTNPLGISLKILLKELVEYTEEQAETAGIPKGFSGEVLSVVSDVTNRGIK